MDRSQWTPTHRVTLDGSPVLTEDVMVMPGGSRALTREEFESGGCGYTIMDGYWHLYGQPFSGEIVDLATGQPVAGACEPLLDPDGGEEEAVEPADDPDDATVDVYPAPMPVCPMCEGPGTELGRLGRFPWYRCRNCGWDWCVEEGGS